MSVAEVETKPSLEERIATAQDSGHYPFMKGKTPATIKATLADLKAQHQAGALKIQTEVIAVKKVTGSPEELATEASQADLLISFLPTYEKLVTAPDGKSTSTVVEVLPNAQPFELLQLPNVASSTNYLRHETINRLLAALDILDEDPKDTTTLARTIIEQVKTRFLIRNSGQSQRTTIALRSAMDRTPVNLSDGSEEEGSEAERLDRLREKGIQLDIADLQVDAAQARFPLAFLQEIERVAIDVFGAENIPHNPKEKMEFLAEFLDRVLDIRAKQEINDAEVARIKALASVFHSMRFYLQFGRLGWVGQNAEVARVMTSLIAVASVHVAKDLATDEAQAKAVLLANISGQLAKANAEAAVATAGQTGNEIGLTVKGIVSNSASGVRSALIDLGIGGGEFLGNIAGKPVETITTIGSKLFESITEKPELPVTISLAGGAVLLVFAVGASSLWIPAAATGAGIGLSALYFGKKATKYLGPMITARMGLGHDTHSTEHSQEHHN